MTDSREGTQERKRAQKAMPPLVPGTTPGCFIAMVVYLAIFGLLLWYSRSWFWALLLVPVALALGAAVYNAIAGRLLMAEAHRVLTPQGVRFLVVHSESPNWEAHIREQWLPRFGNRARLLNWSERSRWGQSLEVRLFNQFIKADRNFNPAVLVLRGSQTPLVFRFYYAFQETKAGRSRYLQQLEDELFEHVHDATPNAPESD